VNQVNKFLPRYMRLFATFILLEIALGLGLSDTLLAGTFIGNGGSAQDLDLDASLALINKNASRIDSKSKNLCVCPANMVNNDLCQVLSRLTTAEKTACREFLIKHASTLADLSSRDSGIKFEWADVPMSVKSKNNSERKVDAVTQTDQRRIIINRKRFSEMPTTFRIALLTHELLHLVKIDGAYIDDDQEAEPFKTGRAKLDTMGAALAMRISEGKDAEQIRELEKVSRARRSHWLGLDILNVSHPSKSAKSLLKKHTSYGYAFSYAWRPDRLGFHLASEGITNQNWNTNGITVIEDLSHLGIGVNYTFNPFNFYLSSWNETHVVFGLTALQGTAKYKAESTGVKIKDSAKTLGIKGSAKVFIPGWNGFWLVLGSELQQVRYEYKNIHIKVIENQNIFTIGGSYGL
jgi:hypothetical protein